MQKEQDRTVNSVALRDVAKKRTVRRVVITALAVLLLVSFTACAIVEYAFPSGYSLLESLFTSGDTQGDDPAEATGNGDEQPPPQPPQSSSETQGSMSSAEESPSSSQDDLQLDIDGIQGNSSETGDPSQPGIVSSNESAESGIESSAASPPSPSHSPSPSASAPPPSASPSPRPSSSPSTSPSPRPSASPSPSTPPPSPTPKVVRSVAVSVRSTDIRKGETLAPTVTISPSDAEDKSYALKSSNENVLCNIDGVWTAVGGGSADLIATASNGVSGKLKITVHVPVEALRLDISEMTMERHSSFTLKAMVSPADTTDRNVSFTTSNSNVATVRNDGTIRATGAGTAVITCTIGGFTAQCTVTVIVPVVSVTVSVKRSRFQLGDVCTFTVDIFPADATDKAYTLSASSGAVITGNTVSCDASGDITITATASNGIAGSRTITVIDLVAFANEVFRLTNLERENAGLEPFDRTPELTKTAVVRANELTSYYSHNRPDGRSGFTAYSENGVTFHAAGENIAAGYMTPKDMVKGWMDSPGHRANILSPEYGHLGCGVAMDSTGRLSWSQEFTD